MAFGTDDGRAFHFERGPAAGAGESCDSGHGHSLLSWFSGNSARRVNGSSRRQRGDSCTGDSEGGYSITPDASLFDFIFSAVLNSNPPNSPRYNIYGFRYDESRPDDYVCIDSDPPFDPSPPGKVRTYGWLINQDPDRATRFKGVEGEPDE
jgi:hypothetical protein